MYNDLSVYGGTIKGIPGYKAGASSDRETLFIAWDFTVEGGAGNSPTPGHTHNFEWQIINEPSLEADGLEAEVCTVCGARRNEQTVSAYGYALYSYGLNKLNGAQPGQTVVLDFGEWNSFPKQFMEKVKEKVDAGVTVTFKFNYQHVPYEITIPAYSTVYTNLEWCGPACMYQLYVLKIPVEN